jgi:hypothetical protein
LGFGFRIWDFGLRVQGLGFLGILEFGVKGLVFRVGFKALGFRL